MAVGDGYVSNYKLGRERYSSSSDMTTMRIAVAGTGGLAVHIASAIAEETSHHVVFLSSSGTHRHALTAAGFQVAVVDYTNGESLAFALRGIDTVISTVGGNSQIALIHAAVHVRVRRFVPAEFEGLPQPQAITPLDQLRLNARRLLHQYADRIQSTIFVCGIFYERFQRGGLQASRMGSFSGVDRQGDYMVDCQNMTGDAAAMNTNGTHVFICMTAARDVARFVTRALDMPIWPTQLSMRGQRIAVYELVQRIQTLRRKHCHSQQPDRIAGRAEEGADHVSNTDRPSRVRYLSAAQIHQCLGHATNPRDQLRFRAMLNTAHGHYDYQDAMLNERFPDVPLTDFNTWFAEAWHQQE